MKTKKIYSLILVLGLVFTGSSFNSAYGQDKKKTTTTTTTTTTTSKHHTMKYTCTMHPKVVMDKPGKCPKCGMTLVEKKEMKKGTMKMMKDSTKMKHTPKMKNMPMK